MILKELVNKAVYGTIGFISCIEDLHNLEEYVVYNLDFLKEFPEIVVATNYKSYPELSKENAALWSKYFPECVLLDSKENKGHNFGTAELDNMLFDYCKEHGVKWLCKSANDVIIRQDVLNTELSESDFYYFNGIGLGGIMHNHNGDMDKVFHEGFFPQTNFYFINVTKCDYLNDKANILEVYEKVNKSPSYNGNPYDYGFIACEQQLKECVKRNKLRKQRLVNDESYKLLLKCIVDYQIHDPSHKNIMINGVCHYHYKDQQVLEIPNI